MFEITTKIDELEKHEKALILNIKAGDPIVKSKEQELKTLVLDEIAKKYFQSMAENTQKFYLLYTYENMSRKSAVNTNLKRMKIHVENFLKVNPESNINIEKVQCPKFIFTPEEFCTLLINMLDKYAVFDFKEASQRYGEKKIARFGLRICATLLYDLLDKEILVPIDYITQDTLKEIAKCENIGGKLEDGTMVSNIGNAYECIEKIENGDISNIFEYKHDNKNGFFGGDMVLKNGENVQLKTSRATLCDFMTLKKYADISEVCCHILTLLGYDTE